MFQRFRNRFRRNVLLCLCMVAAALLLKYQFPEAGQRVGRWVSGAESRVAQVVSDVLDRLSAGDRLSQIVEVFRDAMQDPEVS